MSLSYNKLILLGDSLTEYANQGEGFAYQAALQDLYIRKLDVLNRGYSGYNSDHLTHILPRVLAAESNAARDNVKLITIAIGTNDAARTPDELNKTQAVPIERYQDNLRKLVQLSLDHNVKPILIGPGLVDVKAFNPSLAERGRPTNTDFSTNKRQHQYSQAAEAVANELNVPFVDIWEGLRVHGGWSVEQLYNSTGDKKGQDYISLGEYLHDGLHYTGAAYKILFDKVVTTIKSSYPELSPDNLPLQLSEWRNIDPANLPDSIFN